MRFDPLRAQPPCGRPGRCDPYCNCGRAPGAWEPDPTIATPTRSLALIAAETRKRIAGARRVHRWWVFAFFMSAIGATVSPTFWTVLSLLTSYFAVLGTRHALEHKIEQMKRIELAPAEVRDPAR